MHVLQGSCNLVNVLNYSFLWEVNLVFHGFFDDELQVSLLCPLDSDKELIQFAVDEPAEVLHDVWVI